MFCLFFDSTGFWTSLWLHCTHKETTQHGNSIYDSQSGRFSTRRWGVTYQGPGLCTSEAWSSVSHGTRNIFHTDFVVVFPSFALVTFYSLVYRSFPGPGGLDFRWEECKGENYVFKFLTIFSILWLCSLNIFHRFRPSFCVLFVLWLDQFLDIFVITLHEQRNNTTL